MISTANNLVYGSGDWPGYSVSFSVVKDRYYLISTAFDKITVSSQLTLIANGLKVGVYMDGENSPKPMWLYKANTSSTASVTIHSDSHVVASGGVDVNELY